MAYALLNREHTAREPRAVKPPLNVSSTMQPPLTAFRLLSRSRAVSPRMLRRAPALAACALALTSRILAQTATDKPDDVVTLEKMVAEAKSGDLYGVLPDRETKSVFGTERGLNDTPRSITLVESSMIDLYSIHTVNDFVSITAGSFTGNYFGVPGALDLRGERADNFFRGFRRVENRGNFPTPISSTDYVEILKGPPPPIDGGGKVGGILNFIPKTAKSKTAKLIDKPVGEISATVGTYEKKVGSFEYGTPFSLAGKASGAYIYVQSEDSGSYYNNIYNRDTLVQLAVDTELSDSVLLEYGFMAQHAKLNQSLGWNRVTQKMIDEDGTYMAGRAKLNLDTNGDGFLSPSEVGAYSLEQFAYANPFPAQNLTPEQTAAFELDPATVKFVKLDHHTVQAEGIDFSKTEALTGFFDITKTFSNDLTVKNQSFYDSMNHTKYSSYGFTADYQAIVFENKTTANWKVKAGDKWSLDSVFGASWRYSSGDERESRGRGYQVLDRRDISYGATGNDRFEGAYDGTGNVPYNWRQIGSFTDTGAFALFDNTLFEHLGVIASGRLDYYDATTNGTDLSPTMARVSNNDSAATYNVSVNYKLPGGVTPYVTYATSRYLELGQGGMIDRMNLAAGTWLQDSKLAEAGAKATLLKGKLYTTLAAYEQEKTAFDNQAGTFDRYKSKGVEVEARYAPTKSLSFTGTGTWQRTELVNSPFFLGVTPHYLGLDPAKSYGGRYVAVGALIGVKSPIESPTPNRVFSLSATYTSTKGWGASFGGTYVSSMYSGYLQEITLPSYTVYRAALFYNHGPWSVRLNVNNVFDAKYYTPQFLFWDTFISPSQGPTAELTTTFKW